MKNLHHLLIIFSFTLSCSHSPFQSRSPETQEEKIARYQSKNLPPNPPLAMSISDSGWREISHNFQSTSRGPASVKKDSKPSLFKDTRPRRLYFLALFHQMHILAKHNKQNVSDMSCPAFHSSVIDYKKMFPQKQLIWKASTEHWLNFNFQKANKEIATANFPELALPFTEHLQGASLWSELHTKISPTLTEQQKKELFNDFLNIAFTHWQTRMMNEVKELCEFGHSDNSYAFENLVTSMKEQSQLSKAQSLSALLKITILQNQAILASLSDKNKRYQKRDIAALRPDQILYSDILEQLGASWAFNYFDTH